MAITPTGFAENQERDICYLLASSFDTPKPTCFFTMLTMEVPYLIQHNLHTEPVNYHRLLLAGYSRLRFLLIASYQNDDKNAIIALPSVPL